MKSKSNAEQDRKKALDVLAEVALIEILRLQNIENKNKHEWKLHESTK